MREEIAKNLFCQRIQTHWFFITSLQYITADAIGRNLKIQLLSINEGKTKKQISIIIEDQLLVLFSSITRHDIAVNKKESVDGLSGIPTGPSNTFFQNIGTF